VCLAWKSCYALVLHWANIVGNSCVCRHERQLNKTAPCSLNAVGCVDLDAYYKILKAVEPLVGSDQKVLSRRHEDAIDMPYMQATRVGDAGRGCNWYDDDRCQINLGKKIASRLPGSGEYWR
jgi:hypothetical protein